VFGIKLVFIFASSNNEKQVIMKTSNTVNQSNVKAMKCHIYRMLGFFCASSQLLDAIESAMSHFNYENEAVESVVFQYCLEMGNLTIQEM
jgi:hypothetical protein